MEKSNSPAPNSTLHNNGLSHIPPSPKTPKNPQQPQSQPQPQPQHQPTEYSIINPEIRHVVQPNRVSILTIYLYLTPAPIPLDDLPDPNLLSNLAQLGQVRVQNPAVDFPVPAEEAFRTTPSAFSLPRTNTTRNTTTSRQPVAQPRNTLSAQALSNLLDALKSDADADADADHTLTHAKHLVHHHNLDWDVYQRLARFVNTPTIGRQKQIHLTDDNSNSIRLLKEAIWVDPAYTRASPPS